MATITRTTTTVTRTVTNEPVQRPSIARRWLKTLGFLLLFLAILGLVPFAQGLFHDVGFHIEGGEDLVHWALALVTLVVAFAVRSRLGIAIASIAFGVVYIAAALIGVLEPTIGAWHVGVGDNVLHMLIGTVSLLVGIVALNRERDAANRARRPVVRTTY